jgi:hypothetical protein
MAFQIWLYHYGEFETGSDASITRLGKNRKVVRPPSLDSAADEGRRWPVGGPTTFCSPAINLIRQRPI